MPGRSFMREFEDPFFSDHMGHFNRMHDMFGETFRGFGGMLEDGRRQRGSERTSGRGQEIAPFDENFGFGSFGKVFENMHRNMEKMMQDAQSGVFQSQHGGNGQMYQQTSVMSYSNTGQGPPKVFQASKSTRSGPGEVRETRKALRDSEREIEKMAIGHHINDRGHEVERHKNTRTGQLDEFNNYNNLDESQAESFDREWQEKTRQAFRGLDYGDRRRDRREERRALPDSRQRALPDASSEHWGRTPSESRRDRA